MSCFQVIQGGMGVGVSGWELAAAVARAGQLGVVSGTALATTLARRLQLGDPGGHLRRALAAFPLPDLAQQVLRRYYIAGGKPADAPFKLSPMPRLGNSPEFINLTVLANFAEVFLAKEGHSGLVGINYLEKVQIPTLPSLYGAMLANVDYVLMGAGLPRYIPGALDSLSRGAATSLRIDVEGDGVDHKSACTFDPAAFWPGAVPQLRRPQFLAIISSATLATTLARRSNGVVDGFIVEGPTAGGHNAPPRGQVQFSDTGQPIYGERDVVDLAKMREVGLPFYLAGGYSDPARLAEALDAGASGVQIGTAFAFCDESGMDPALRQRAIDLVLRGETHVVTDPKASPTGFPFKVLRVAGTMSDAQSLGARQRLCDLGYLRRPYRKEDGSIGYRCPAEPVDQYVAKGGDVADTAGRICICNALCATVSLAQCDADGCAELPLLTAGDDIANITRYIKPGARSYTAADVLNHVLSGRPNLVGR